MASNAKNDDNNISKSHNPSGDPTTFTTNDEDRREVDKLQARLKDYNKNSFVRGDATSSLYRVPSVQIA